jgi:hypothetical protein
VVDQFGVLNSVPEWREVRPIRHRSSPKNIPEIIRVCFSYWGEGKSGLVIYIGKQILKSLAIEENSRIRFFVDDDNPRRWVILPSDGVQGYQLGRASEGCVKCQIMWRVDIPHEWERKTRRVDFQLNAEGIQINAEFQPSSYETAREKPTGYSVSACSEAGTDGVPAGAVSSIS